MEGDGPLVSLCTKPPLRARAGEVTSATISQPGVSLRWPTVPSWEPQNSPVRDFPLRSPTPTGDGCFNVDPGATAAPGPATLSVGVGNLSSFSTKVEYYESVAVAFARRPFIAEPMGALLLMPARDVMEAHASSTSGVTVSLDLPFAKPPRTIVWSSTNEKPLLHEPEQILTFSFDGLPSTVNQDVQLTFSLASGQKFTKWRRLMRVPPPPRGSFISPVQVDHGTKSLLLEGRPYDGVGFYLDALDHPHGAFHNLSEYIVKEAAPNRVGHGMIYRLYTFPAETQLHIMDQAASVGFHLMYELPTQLDDCGNQYRPGRPWPPTCFNDTASAGLEQLRQAVALVKDHPALLGYYVCVSNFGFLV